MRFPVIALYILTTTNSFAQVPFTLSIVPTLSRQDTQLITAFNKNESRSLFM